jgi:hypothetical protein
MQKTIRKKIGKEVHTFIVEGSNLYELVTESQKLSFNDVERCGCCKSDNLILNSRLAMNKYKYVEVKCADCRASVVFGSMMENPDIFFLRKNDSKQLAWQAYSSAKV